MAFEVTPFSAAPPVAPGLPAAKIAVQYRVVGDFWTFVVTFVSQKDGAPIILAGLTPHADLLLGYGAAPAPLTVLPPVAGDAANTVRFGIDTDPTHQGGISVVPQGQLAATYPVRLHTYLVDSLGRDTTYAITAVVPVDPKTVDLGILPQPSQVIAVGGSAGQQGIAGIAASLPDIENAVNAAIPDVVLETLVSGGLPTSGDNLVDLIDSRIRAVLAEFSNTGQLVGAIQGGSVLAGNLTVEIEIQLAGVIQGQSVLSGIASRTYALAGTIQGQSVLSGAVMQGVALAGAIQGQSLLVASVTQSIALAGVIPGASQLSGALTTTPPTSMLSGTVQGQSVLTGSLIQAVALAGVVKGQSALVGVVTQSIALAGTIQGSSALRGSISQSVALAGVIQGQSRLAGSATQAIGFAGAVDGRSTLTGNLTVVQKQQRSPLFDFLFLDAA